MRLTHLLLATTLIPFAPLALGSAAALPLVDDRRVGSSGVAYVDSEYWSEGRKMAFMDAALDLWVCDVDPSMGALIPEDGRGVRIGPGAPFALAINSVDGGFSWTGASVYAATTNADGRTGPEKAFSLSAGRSVTYSGVLGSVFGLASDYGAIRISSSSSALGATSQTSTSRSLPTRARRSRRSASRSRLAA